MPAPVKIDRQQLEELAALGCGLDEIGWAVGLDPERLRVRLERDSKLRAAVEHGRAAGRRALRELQQRHAEGDGMAATVMTIHLSKHMLGQHDRALAAPPVDPGMPDFSNAKRANGIGLKRRTPSGEEIDYRPGDNVTRFPIPNNDD